MIRQFLPLPARTNLIYQWTSNRVTTERAVLCLDLDTRKMNESNRINSLLVGYMIRHQMQLVRYRCQSQNRELMQMQSARGYYEESRRNIFAEKQDLLSNDSSQNDSTRILHNFCD